MSFYRNLLAAIAAVAIASPVFALHHNANAANHHDEAAQGASYEQRQVNINTASVKELMRVKGINASKARAVVAYRKKHGSFKTLEALAKVKGFSRMKGDDLRAIQEQLTIS